MSTASRVPETWELHGDDAWRTLRQTGTGALLRDAFLRLRWADGFSHARSLAFVVSLVAAQGVIALVGLASAFGDRAIGSGIVRVLGGAAPGPAGDMLVDAVRHARRAGSGQQYFGLAFGLVGALVAAATAMGQIERALNRLYGVEQDRPTLQKYVRATVLALTAGLLASVGFALAAFGPAISDAIGGSLAHDLRVIVRWPLALVCTMASMALLFRWAPRRRQPAWSWLAFGATVSVVAWVAVSALLGWFFELNTSFGEAYGPLAGTVAFLLWAVGSAIAILYGAAVAAQLEAVRAGVPGPQDRARRRWSFLRAGPDTQSPPTGERSRSTAAR